MKKQKRKKAEKVEHYSPSKKEFHLLSSPAPAFVHFFLKIGHFFHWCFHLLLPDNFKEDPGFTDHVKLFFMTRHYSYLRKFFVVWMFVITTTIGVTGYNIYQARELGAANATFPFDISGSYTFDSARVNVTGSEAVLLSVDQIDNDNTATGFAGGTFSDTNFATSHVGLDATGLTNGTGTFTSRIINAGGSVAWNQLDWTPERPIQKELPNNSGIESAYSTGNMSMTGNVLLMHLNETSGTITDSSVNGNTATGTGITYASQGIFGTGIDLTGNGDKIESSAFNYVFGTEITLAGWFRFTGPGTGSPRILEISRLGDSNTHALAPDGDGSLRAWAVCNNGSRVGSADDPTNYNDGQWHHFVYTYSNPTGIIYVDGVQTATASNACANLDDGSELILGAISDVSGNFTNAQHEFDGYIDEMAAFNRALTPTEVQDIYLRGALRQQIQVRTCDDAICDTEVFVGSDGTNGTFFSELLNSTTGLPSLAMPLPNNQYFQYQVTLETDDNVTNSRLSNVTIGPSHLDGGSPTIQNTSGIAYTSSLDSFTETLGGGHTGTTTYQLSNNGANFYYFNGGSWSPAVSSVQSNTAGIIGANITTFVNDVGTGNFFFRAFLGSNLGTQVIELDQIELTFDTGGGGGGGGSSKIFFLPPSAPGDGFQVIINEKAEQTTDQIVDLTFNAGNEVSLVELSNEQSFIESITLGLTPTIEWDLCSVSGKPVSRDCPDGEYTVYANFLTSLGQPPSPIVSDTITLGEEEEEVVEEEPVVTEPETETEETPDEEVIIEQEQNEPPITPAPSEPEETTEQPEDETQEPSVIEEEIVEENQQEPTPIQPSPEQTPPQPPINQNDPTTAPPSEVNEGQIIQTVTQEIGTNNYLLTVSTGEELEQNEKVFVQFLSGALAGQSIVLDEYVANDQEIFFYTPLQVNPSPGDKVKVSGGTVFKQETFVSPKTESTVSDFKVSAPEKPSLLALQIVIAIGLFLGLFILFSLWKQNTALTTLIEHEHANLYHKGKHGKH